MYKVFKISNIFYCIFINVYNFQEHCWTLFKIIFVFDDLFQIQINIQTKINVFL